MRHGHHRNSSSKYDRDHRDQTSHTPNLFYFLLREFQLDAPHTTRSL